MINQRVDVEKNIMEKVPKQIMIKKVKRDFVNSRFMIMQRTSITEARNKMVSEWTQQKMIDKAMKLAKEERIKREEERQEKLQAEMMRAAALEKPPTPDLTEASPSPPPSPDRLSSAMDQ